MSTNNSNKMYFINAASLTNASSAGTTAPGVFAVYNKESDSLRVYDNNEYEPGANSYKWDVDAFNTLRADLGLPEIVDPNQNQYYWDPDNYAQPFSWSGSAVLPMAALFPKSGDTVSFYGTKDELFSIAQTGFESLAKLKFSGGIKVDKIILTDAEGTDDANLGRIFITADQARLLAVGGIKIDQLNTVIQDSPANIDLLVKDITAAASTLGAKLAQAGVTSIYVDPASFIAGAASTYTPANMAALAGKGITTTLEINSALDLRTIIQKDPSLSLYTSGLKVDLGNGLVDPTTGVLMDPVEGDNSTSELTSWMSTFTGTKLNVDAGVFLKLYSSGAYESAGPEIEQMHLKAGVDVTISASVESLLALSNPNPAFDNQSLKDAAQAMAGVADKFVIYTNGGDSLLGVNENGDTTDFVRNDLLNDHQVFDPQSGQIVTGDGALNKIEQALGDTTTAAKFIEIKSTTGATNIPVDAALQLADAGFKFAAGDSVSATVRSIDLAKADSLAVYTYSVDRYDSMQLYTDNQGHTFAGRSDVNLDTDHNNTPYIWSYNSQANGGYGGYEKVYVSGDITWSANFTNAGQPADGDYNWQYYDQNNPINHDNYSAEYDYNTGMWKAKVAYTEFSTATVASTDNGVWTSGGESSMLSATQQWTYNYNTWNYEQTTNASTTQWNVAAEYNYSYYDWWYDTTYNYSYGVQTQATVAQNLNSVADYGQGRIWKFDGTQFSENDNAASFYMDSNNDGIDNDGELGGSNYVDMGEVRVMGATYSDGQLHVKIATDLVDGSGNTTYYRADIDIVDTADNNLNGIVDGAERFFDQNTYSYVYQGKDGRVDSQEDYDLLQTAQNQGYYFDFNSNGMNDAWEGIYYSAQNPIYDINGDGINDVPDADNNGLIDSSLFSTVSLEDLHALANAGLDSIVVTGQQLMFPLSNGPISSDPESDSYQAAQQAAADLVDTLAHSSLKFLTEDGKAATLVFSDVRADLNALDGSNGYVTAIEPVAITVDAAVRLAAQGIKMAGADGNGILRIVDTAVNIQKLVSDGSLVTAQAIRDIGVVDIDIMDGKRIDLKLDQAKAMGLAGLHFDGDSVGTDYVSVVDDVAKINSITAAQIVALGSLGVDKINGTMIGTTPDKTTLTVDVNKMRALVESGVVVDASDTLQLNIKGDFLLNQGVTDLADIADSIARVGLDQINGQTATGTPAQLELTANGFNAFKDFIIGTSTTEGIYKVAPTVTGKDLSGIKVITTSDADLSLIGSVTERKNFEAAGMTITKQAVSDVGVNPNVAITEGESTVLGLINFFKFNNAANKNAVTLTDVIATGVKDVTFDLPGNSGLTILHQTINGWQRADRVEDGRGGYNYTLELDDLAAGNYSLQHDGTATQGEIAFNDLKIIVGTQQQEFVRVSDSTTKDSGYSWFSDGKTYSLFVDGIEVASHTFSELDDAYDATSAAVILKNSFAEQLALSDYSGDVSVAVDYDRLKFTWTEKGLQELVNDNAQGTAPDLNKFTSRISMVQGITDGAGVEGEDLRVNTATLKKSTASANGKIELLVGTGTTLRAGDKFQITLTSSAGTGSLEETLTLELKQADFIGANGAAVSSLKAVANAINTAMKLSEANGGFTTSDKNALGYLGTESQTILSNVATVTVDAAKNEVAVSIAVQKVPSSVSTSTYPNVVIAKNLASADIAQTVEVGSSDIEQAVIKGLGGVYVQEMSGTEVIGGTGDYFKYTAVDKAPTVGTDENSAVLNGVQGTPAIYLDGITLTDSDGVSSMDELSISLTPLRGNYDGKFKTVTLDSWVHVYKDGSTTESLGSDRYNLNAKSLTLTVKKSDLVNSNGDALVDLNHDGTVDGVDTLIYKNIDALTRIDSGMGLVGAMNAALDSVSFELGKVLRSTSSDSTISFDVTTSNKTNAVLDGTTVITPAANPSANSLVTYSYVELIDQTDDGLITTLDYTITGINSFDNFVSAVQDNDQEVVLKLANSITIDSLKATVLLDSGKTVDSGKYKLTAEVGSDAWDAAGNNVLSLINAGIDRVNFNDVDAANILLGDLNAVKSLADVQLLGNMAVTGVQGTAAAQKETFVLPWAVSMTQETTDGTEDGSLMIKDVLDQTTLRITNFDIAATDVIGLSKFSGKAPTLVTDQTGYNFVDMSGSFDAADILGIRSVGTFAVAVAGNYDGGLESDDVAISFVYVTGQDTNNDGAINGVADTNGVFDTFTGQQAGTVELLGVSLASVTSSIFAIA